MQELFSFVLFLLLLLPSSRFSFSPHLHSRETRRCPRAIKSNKKADVICSSTSTKMQPLSASEHYHHLGILAYHFCIRRIRPTVIGHHHTMTSRHSVTIVCIMLPHLIDRVFSASFTLFLQSALLLMSN